VEGGDDGVNVLAGDIGGTHTRLALVRVTQRGMEVIAEHHYPSRSAPALRPLVQQFLAEIGTKPQRAGLAVAGPVVNGVCHASNLPWVVSAKAIAKASGIPRVVLLNDFAALGYGLGRLQPVDLVTLQPGTVDPKGVVALIGAGTGLGEAFVLRGRGRARVLASEGGHTDFAPDGERAWGLFEYLRARYGHVSWERVLSGNGLVDIYHYLASRGEPAPHPDVAQEMRAAKDPAAVVSRHGLEGTDPLAEEAISVFAEVYGAQAGNLALTVFATGGVYVAGGIAPQILAKLQDGTFIKAFLSKGRLLEVLERIPVRVIVNPRVALWGAAEEAARA
jgi:glucokinase